MTVIGKSRTTRAFRITGHVLGIIIVAFILLFIIGEGIDDIRSNGWGNIDYEVAFVVVPAVVAVIGYAFSWWRELTGGILLIIGYFLFAFSPPVLSAVRGDGFKIFPAMWLYMLPMLLSGVLFVLAAVYTRRTSV